MSSGIERTIGSRPILIPALTSTLFRDGAEVYKTETELGTAIKEAKIPREKLYVTTKVISNISDIPGALATSLKKLQLSYVDLCVDHN